MLTANQYHSRFHKFCNGYNIRPELCRNCQEERARCREKVLFKSRDKAEMNALSVNIERNWYPGECLIPYRCRQCHYWHNTQAKRSEQRQRAEKMRMRWLRTQKKRKKLEREIWMEIDYLEDRPHFDTQEELLEYLYLNPTDDEGLFEWDEEVLEFLDGDWEEV